MGKIILDKRNNNKKDAQVGCKRKQVDVLRAKKGKPGYKWIFIWLCTS